MNDRKTDKTRTPDSSMQSMSAEKKVAGSPSGLNREIQAKIGQQLRAMYDDVVQEGVPDRFVSLLRQLDEPESKPSTDEGKPE